jgi:hypothetical protein
MPVNTGSTINPDSILLELLRAGCSITLPCSSILQGDPSTGHIDIGRLDQYGHFQSEGI